MEQYKYIPLVKDNDGHIKGLVHDGLDPALNCISEIGVTTSNGSCCGGTSDLPSVDTTRLEPPEVPPGQGSIACTWYMTKASLVGLLKVQVCRDPQQPHHPVLGLLLFHSDELIESLGQVRWEHGLSQEIAVPISIKHETIDGQDYVKDIRSGSDVENKGWQKLPEVGTIVWWFSRVGDRIIIHGDSNACSTTVPEFC